MRTRYFTSINKVQSKSPAYYQMFRRILRSWELQSRYSAASVLASQSLRPKSWGEGEWCSASSTSSSSTFTVECFSFALDFSNVRWLEKSTMRLCFAREHERICWLSQPSPPPETEQMEALGAQYQALMNSFSPATLIVSCSCSCACILIRRLVDALQSCCCSSLCAFPVVKLRSADSLYKIFTTTRVHWWHARLRYLQKKMIWCYF